MNLMKTGMERYNLEYIGLIRVGVYNMSFTLDLTLLGKREMLKGSEIKMNVSFSLTC